VRGEARAGGLPPANMHYAPNGRQRSVPGGKRPWPRMRSSPSNRTSRGAVENQDRRILRSARATSRGRANAIVLCNLISVTVEAVGAR